MPERRILPAAVTRLFRRGERRQPKSHDGADQGPQRNTSDPEVSLYDTLRQNDAAPFLTPLSTPNPAQSSEKQQAAARRQEEGGSFPDPFEKVRRKKHDPARNPSPDSE